MSNKTRQCLVMKFGGASLEHASSIKKVSSIIYWSSQKNNVIVVVSAIKNVTNKLLDVLELIKRGEVVLALKTTNAIYNDHLNILRDIDPSIQSLETEQKLKYLFDMLKLYIKKVNHKKVGDSQRDYIISFGERMSVHIVTHSLRYVKKVKSLALDTTSLLKTTKEFGKAKPLLNETTSSMKRILDNCLTERIVPVITGYVGHAPDGCITTLGRGGSDLTATLIASLMSANKVILWKDVVGLYDKDPKINPSAKLFKITDYHTAMALSKNGAKILHSESLEPLENAKIPLQIKSFLFPKGPGTLIVDRV